MLRASCPTLLALLLCQIPLFAQAGKPNGLITDRRDVPLDPLDGIPEEDPSRGKGKSKAHSDKSVCRLLVTPGDDRELAAGFLLSDRP